MVILGLVLIVVGALAIVAAVFASSGSAELLGLDLNSLTIFLIGVAAGAAILWGFSILKYGTKRGIQQRRERKKLSELSDKLDKVEAERAADRQEDS